MVESDSDSMRNCSSQGTRVPRPKEREHAHHFSHPAASCSSNPHVFAEDGRLHAGVPSYSVGSKHRWLQVVVPSHTAGTEQTWLPMQKFLHTWQACSRLLPRSSLAEDHKTAQRHSRKGSSPSQDSWESQMAGRVRVLKMVTASSSK